MRLRMFLGAGALVTFCVGRWSVGLLAPPRKWFWWAWGEYGYDCIEREWYFGPFGEVTRAEDWVMELENGNADARNTKGDE